MQLGGYPGGPPHDKFCRVSRTATFSATPLHEFFLLSLTDHLTPSLRKMDILLQSCVTFCDQRSTPKLRVFSFCVQNEWQSVDFSLFCKSVISLSLGLIYSLFQLNIDPDDNLKYEKLLNNHKTIKYKRIEIDLNNVHVGKCL